MTVADFMVILSYRYYFPNDGVIDIIEVKTANLSLPFPVLWLVDFLAHKASIYKRSTALYLCAIAVTCFCASIFPCLLTEHLRLLAGTHDAVRIQVHRHELVVQQIV